VSNKKEKIRTLLKLGADINYMDGGGLTPTMSAVAFAGQYDIALELLKAGADPKIYQPNSNSKW
jgi:ankyrin repeat protein